MKISDIEKAAELNSKLIAAQARYNIFTRTKDEYKLYFIDKNGEEKDCYFYFGYKLKEDTVNDIRMFIENKLVNEINNIKKEIELL